MEYSCFSVICNYCGEIFPASPKTIQYNEYENDRTEESQAFNMIMCPACSAVEVLELEE